MTICYDKHELQQAFKELSISLTKQLSIKSNYSHSFTTQPYDLLITDNNNKANNTNNNNNNSNNYNNKNNNNVSLTSDNLTPTLNLVHSVSSPTSSTSSSSLNHLNDESSKIIKKKSILYDILHSKQQPDYLPYTPFMNMKSTNDSSSSPLTHIYHHDHNTIDLLHHHSSSSSNLSNFSITPPSSIYSSDSSISSNSSNSSHYGESIPTTPTLSPNKAIHQNSNHNTIITKKMRRVLSSSSSLASLTTHSSTKSKSSITNHHHLKWDWTIEESTLYHQRDENGKIKSSESSSINEVTERDIYGFKKPAEWVSLKKIHEFDHNYQSILIHQKEKWDQLLEEHDHEFPSLSSRVKRYVRKGIPHSYRGKAWMHYSGAKKRMDANPGLYEILLESVNKMGQKNEYAEVIVRDLHRTFPENIHFTCTQQDEEGNINIDPESNPRLVSLKNILLAFTIHSPQIGYCQSLNYLVGLFILFTESEEEAFWLLVAVVHDYAPEKMYDPTMDGSITEQMVLMMMIYERMPSIWNKFANGRCFWECEQSDNMPSVTLVTNHWFLTMFINILPIETVLRIWDCFFIEGSKVLYKVALTLIKMNEQRMWSLNDPMEIFPILQNMPRRLIDCHKFMERVFSKTGIASDITTQEIGRIRGLFKDRRKQRRYKRFDEMVRNN